MEVEEASVVTVVVSEAEEVVSEAETVAVMAVENVVVMVADTKWAEGKMISFILVITELRYLISWERKSHFVNSLPLFVCLLEGSTERKEETGLTKGLEWTPF